MKSAQRQSAEEEGWGRKGGGVSKCGLRSRSLGNARPETANGFFFPLLPTMPIGGLPQISFRRKLAGLQVYIVRFYPPIFSQFDWEGEALWQEQVWGEGGISRGGAFSGARGSFLPCIWWRARARHMTIFTSFFGIFFHNIYFAHITRNSQQILTLLLSFFTIFQPFSDGH